MSWKALVGSSLLSTGLALGFAVTPARAVDAVLYEVTEDVKLTGRDLSFRSSNAKLMGRVHVGNAICPQWLADALKISSCALTVNAVGRVDEKTGIGPMNGSFQVVAQDWNTADGPEIIIMRATINGTIDLSPGLRGQPIGYINGKYNASGEPFTILSGYRQNGSFDGTFRLPFSTPAGTFYLSDSGPVPVQPEELSLGVATVKLEVNVYSR